MIHVLLRENGFVILGHANYAKHGEDIVCSAVSSLTQTIAMGLEKFCDAGYLVDQGDISVMYDEQDTISKMLVDVMMLGLTEIEQEYPNHIRIIRKKGKVNEQN